MHANFKANGLVLKEWPQELCDVRSITDIMNIQESTHFGPKSSVSSDCGTAKVWPQG
jgi:hypothetical protein